MNLTMQSRGRSGVLRQLWPAALVIVTSLFVSAGSSAQIPKADVVVKLLPIASDLNSPLTVTHANDASGRLFIVDQTGLILVMRDGEVLPTPFLDLSADIPELNTGFDVRGLLGLAFHPFYASNGRFFVRHSESRPGDPNEPCFGSERGCNAELVVEYNVSADPDVASPTGTEIFRVNAPEYDHNAGEIAFGPDGYLYFTLGDGGGKNDGLHLVPPAHGPIGNGQNIETTLGSMLRIDVDSPPAPGLGYAVPSDNPFVGVTGADEIYAYGFRNPYRFSFDNGLGGSGALIVADVGQELFEEINIVYKGGNYGWAAREGSICFDPTDPEVPLQVCDETGPLGEPFVDPIAEYGTGVEGVSAIGGYVYRGARAASLNGRYVFGDFTKNFSGPLGRLFLLDEPGPNQYNIQELRVGVADDPYGYFLKGFGEDEQGEIYACGTTGFSPFGTSGVVQKLAETIVIGSCDTNTDNVSLTAEVGVLDFVQACSAAASNNQTFVACMVAISKGLRTAQILTGPEAANLVRCATAQQSWLIAFDNNGDESGVTVPGASNFSIYGSNWNAGIVDSNLAPEFTASAPASYAVSSGVSEATFDFGVDSVNFFYVHGGGIPAGVATAFDAKGTAVASVASLPATSLGDAANIVSLNPFEPIARIEFSGGAIDNFGFTTQEAPISLAGDLNDDGQVNAADLSAILFSLGDCPALGPCPSDLDDNGIVEIVDVLDLFFGVPCEPGNCIFDFTGDGTANAQDLLIYAYFLYL